MTSIVSGALVALLAWSSTGLPGANLALEQGQIAGTNEQTYSVRMTGYNAVPEQTNEDPTTTASGARSNPDIVVARSRDLAEELPYGTIIEIVTSGEQENPCGLSSVEHAIGYRVVADTMHPRKKNQIDVMFEVNETVKVGKKHFNPALALGICEEIEIRVVGFVDIKDIPTSQFALAARVQSLPLALGN